MKLVTIARVASVIGAIGWFLGLPIVALTAVPFASDASYYFFGLVTGLLGLVVIPLALAYPASPSSGLTEVGRGFGVVVGLALLATGLVLAAGAIGYLGERPPTWVANAPEIGVVGFFAWILLASYVARNSKPMGRFVFWLGVLAAGSVLLPSLIWLLIYFLDPGFNSTNATIPFEFVSALLTWVCLPIWLIAVAIRMPVAPRKANELDDRGRMADVTPHPPPTAVR